MVEYYQTHDVGINKVAAIFNIPVSLIWLGKVFKHGGLATLIPRQKGRSRLFNEKGTGNVNASGSTTTK